MREVSSASDRVFASLRSKDECREQSQPDGDSGRIGRLFGKHIDALPTQALLVVVSGLQNLCRRHLQMRTNFAQLGEVEYRVAGLQARVCRLR